MTIREILSDKKITKILHFTTSDGLLGMLAGVPPQLLPRAQLAESAHLEFILKLNAPTRTDTDWFGYNSLSISEINPFFFKYSLRNHPEACWVVLEFSEEILTHEGVYFATTNNIYAEVVRDRGAEGLDALFAPKIKTPKRNGWIERKDHPQHCPTDKQAEVLYPGPLSFEYLKKIHVADKTACRLVKAQLAACNCTYEVHISPEHFPRDE